MKLKFVSNETLADLKINHGQYKSHYYNRDETWFKQYFSEEGRVLESKIDFEIPQLVLNGNHAENDGKNAKILYESLRHLTPSQAVDERIWVGLAHLQLRDYILHRLEKELKDKNEKRTKTGFFLLAGGLKRSLFVHVISRLWWVAHMTYDRENPENPYWLTEFFTESDFSARSVLVFSSNFTSNRDILLGILKSLYSWKEQQGAIKREHFVSALKHLNIIGGATILDVLSVDEIKDIVLMHLNEQFAKKKVDSVPIK